MAIPHPEQPTPTEAWPRHLPLAVLAVTLVAFTVLWAIYPQSFVASDPWRYSQNAFLIAEGAVREGMPNHPFGHRLAVTLPVAAIYRVAGVSLHTTNLWPLIAALAILVAVWLASDGAAARCYAVVLCALTVPLVRSAVTLYPDVIATAFAALSSLALSRRRAVLAGPPAGRALPYVAALLLFGGFLAKETILWLGPLWLAVLVWDLRRGDRALVRRFYVPAALTGLALGVGYLWLSDVIWGDPLARLHGVNSVAGGHIWAAAMAGAVAFTKRMTVSPVRVLVVELGTVVVPAALAIAAAYRRRSFWAAYTLSVGAMFWLAPTSLTTYAPISAIWRHALLLLPGLAVLAGEACALARLGANGPYRLREVRPYVLIVGLAALPLLAHLDEARTAPRTEQAAMAVVRTALAGNPDRRYLLVTADERSAEALAFYFGYRYPPNLVVTALDRLTADELAAAQTAYVFLDEDRSRMLAERYGEPNEAAAVRRLGLPEVLGAGAVHLYVADDSSALEAAAPP